MLCRLHKNPLERSAVMSARSCAMFYDLECLSKVTPATANLFEILRYIVH